MTQVTTAGRLLNQLYKDSESLDGALRHVDPRAGRVNRSAQRGR